VLFQSLEEVKIVNEQSLRFCSSSCDMSENESDHVKKVVTKHSQNNDDGDLRSFELLLDSPMKRRMRVILPIKSIKEEEYNSIALLSARMTNTIEMEMEQFQKLQHLQENSVEESDKETWSIEKWATEDGQEIDETNPWKEFEMNEHQSNQPQQQYQQSLAILTSKIKTSSEVISSNPYYIVARTRFEIAEAIHLMNKKNITRLIQVCDGKFLTLAKVKQCLFIFHVCDIQ
jgi:hypothetical protein